MISSPNFQGFLCEIAIHSVILHQKKQKSLKMPDSKSVYFVEQATILKLYNQKSLFMTFSYFTSPKRQAMITQVFMASLNFPCEYYFALMTRGN